MKFTEEWIEGYFKALTDHYAECVLCQNDKFCEKADLIVTYWFAIQAIKEI